MNKKMDKWLFARILIYLVIFGGVAALAAPNLIRKKRVWESFLCVQSLEKIDEAITRWGADHKKKYGDSVAWDDLLKGGYLREIPKCPSVRLKISYKLNAFGWEPECLSNLPGHAVPVISCNTITDVE